MIDRTADSLSANSRAEQLPVYDSIRRAPPFWEELVEAWRYRDLIWQLVARDIRLRYKRSALGVAWTMLNPLGMMIVLTVVFSHLFRISLPHYPVYVLSGMLLWNLFAQSTTAAMSQLIWGGPLLSRIYVPRTLFALSAVGTGLVNLVLALVPLSLIMLVTGVPLRPVLIWLPIPILLTAIFTLGAALVLSGLGVSFPDLVDMYQIAISAWYFLTPILYPKTILPEASWWWFNLNPMYHLVEAFRAPVYLGVAPSLQTLITAIMAAVAMFSLGWMIFTARADEIAYRV